MSKLNADDIRRITIEVLCDLELIQPITIESINFIDDVVKTEILLRKTALKIVEPIN